ncbi:MAG: glycosyltransferase [Lachnospiraceae bacterium]
MLPPLLSYITFNRLGLTVKNLKSILNSSDDFEMHLIDNGSTDGTWKYLQSLNDSRILSRARLNLNFGQIYALNLNLLKRRPDQYFITVDNDVYIETTDWISRFSKVFETFPEVGMLGIQKNPPDPEFLPPVLPKVKDGIFYLEVDNSHPDINRNYVPGYCVCLRPELINEIGYWSEENCFGDVELSNRINNYTSFKTGFVTNISIQMPQTLECSSCEYRAQCPLNKYKETCFTNYPKLNCYETFKKMYQWKFDETVNDLKSGARPVYCASGNDINSISNHIYNQEWAQDNLSYFIKNAN